MVGWRAIGTDSKFIILTTLLLIVSNLLLCSSVSHTNRHAKEWWEVKFGSSYKINLVVVYLRHDCCQKQIDGAVVYAGTTKCGMLYSRKKVYTAFVSCNGASAKYVRIMQTNSKHLMLAEVQVFGGPQAIEGLNLLSWNQKATQSSMGHGGVAMRAVDGYASGRWDRHSVTHSQFNRDNWWQVDLGGTYAIYLVLIHNRYESPARIFGTQVYIDMEYCGSVVYIPYMRTFPVNCAGQKGRRVKVVNQKDYLQLAEVQVYGKGYPSGGTGGVFATQVRGSYKYILYIVIPIF